jgi:prefoldin subunit 5
MFPDSTKRINAKFKNLKKALKTWKAQLPNLASTIQNSKDLIQFLDILEEHRDLPYPCMSGTLGV